MSIRYFHSETSSDITHTFFHIFKKRQTWKQASFDLPVFEKAPIAYTIQGITPLVISYNCSSSFGQSIPSFPLSFIVSCTFKSLSNVLSIGDTSLLSFFMKSITRSASSHIVTITSFMSFAHSINEDTSNKLTFIHFSFSIVFLPASSLSKQNIILWSFASLTISSTPLSALFKPTTFVSYWRNERKSISPSTTIT